MVGDQSRLIELVHGRADESMNVHSAHFSVRHTSGASLSELVVRGSDFILFVVEGELNLEIADRMLQAPAHSLVVIPQGVEHRYGSSVAKGTRYLAVSPVEQ